MVWYLACKLEKYNVWVLHHLKVYMWKSNIHVCHQAEKLLKYFNVNGSLATETKLVWNLAMNRSFYSLYM